MIGKSARQRALPTAHRGSIVGTPSLRRLNIVSVLLGGVALYLAMQLRNPLYFGLRPVLRSLTLGAPLIVLVLLLLGYI